MAASANSVRFGRAFVELFLEDEKFRRGLKNAGRSMQRLGAGLKNIGGGMMRAGGMMALPIVAAGRVFMSFDDQMRATKAVTEGTGEEFERLTEKAKMLGRTTSFTASQVAESMKTLGKAGFSRGGIDNAIEGVLDLARATETGLPESAQIAADTMNQFGMTAKAIPEIVDVLTATANNSAQSLTDLAESMSYSGPIFDEFGSDLQSASKALGMLAGFGLRGSTAGTAMRTMMTNLTDSAKLKQLENMVGTVRDANGEFLPLEVILKKIGKATANLPTPERMGFIKEIFGKRAITGALKLTGDLTGRFAGLEKAINNAGGTAAATAKEMDAGLGGSFRKLISAVEGVALAFAGAMESELGEMIDWMTKMMGELSKFIEQNPQLAKTFLLVATALITFGTALMAGGVILAILGTAISTAATFIGGFFSAIAAVPGILMAIFSPVGLLIAGLVAIGVILAMLAKKFLEWSGIWGATTSVVAEKWKTLVAVFKRGGLAAAVKVAWLMIKLYFTKGIGAVKGMWVKLTTGLKSTWVKLWADIRLIVLKVMEGIVLVFNGVVGGVAVLANKLRGAFDKSFDVDAANKKVQEMFSVPSVDDKVAASEQRREDALAKIREDRNKRLGDLDKDVAAAEAELQKAIMEGMKKTKEVKKEAKLPDVTPTPDSGGKGSMPAFNFTDQSGTFSGAVAKLLGAKESEEKKILKANEATAFNTQRLLEFMQQTNLEYI